MIHHSSLLVNVYISVLAYRGEERREVQVLVCGLTAETDYVVLSSTFEVRGGLAITAAAVVVVLPYYPPVLACT